MEKNFTKTYAGQLIKISRGFISLLLLINIDIVDIQAQVFTQSDTDGSITITPKGLRGKTTNNNIRNVSLGANSLLNNSTGNDNTAIGYNALYFNFNGFENTAIGSNSMQFLNNTAHYNTAVGAGSMGGNLIKGDGNTGVGRWALYRIKTGCCNTGVGEGALSSDTSGTSNVAIGSWSLNSLKKNNGNTAVGVSALYKSEGSANTAIGNYSLDKNINGNLNVAVGYNSNVGFDNLINSIVIGANTTVNASNKIRLGNSNITVIEGQVAYSYPSDGRFKNNIKEDIKGLDFITKLRPVSYNFDTQAFDKFTNGDEGSQKTDFSVSMNIKHNGFIAQEVEKTMNEIGYNFDGISIPKDKNQTYSLSYSQFVVPLVKAVQEQQIMIESLKEETKKLLNIVAELKKELKNE
ncbi:tail fiber domain-containing protein [Emticicia agri]|uniref:Peptidase S74 domain-containing protein n=1 Tax=Emticicia agri TaxID=2492393 RepID=A0A4Q5LNW1_9BACT|nr:tail fiber domain-containing protein [Emticicia agri]RYU91053.1 hypothetical protein EWM59_27070 [Emticicia agri]